MFKFTHNVDQVIGHTARLHPQWRFATAVALTRTMKDVEQAAYVEMNSVWDRPTPFSQRSLFTRPATKVNLEASVQIKDRFPSKASASPQEIYQHQYFGGVRRRKGLERYAERAGLIGSTEILVPASGAKLDAYGNVSRGQLSQIMSQLRLGLDPYSWKSSSTRSKAGQKKAGLMFWSRGGHLRRGIWVRRGRSIAPLMLVAPQPAYKARMDLGKVGTRTMDARFGAHLDDAWSTAIATAR